MEGGDSFFLLFLGMFFVVFALKLLSLSSGILVRFGSIVGLNATKPSFSIFWAVLLAIVILFMIYGNFDAPMRQQDGTAGNVLALLMVIGGLISLYNLFTPKELTPPVPESSSGLGFSGIFIVIVIFVILAVLIVGYFSINGSSGHGSVSRSSSPMKMENGTVITLSTFMLFVAIFALHYLFSSHDTPASPSKSTGFGFLTLFGFSGVFVVIVIVFLIVGYVSLSRNGSSSSSSGMESGTVIALSVFMVFVAIFAVNSLSASKDAPVQESMFDGFLGFCLSPYFWFVIVVIMIFIAFYGSYDGKSASVKNMDSGTVITVSVLMMCVAVLALRSLVSPNDSTPKPSKSTGSPTLFFGVFGFIVIVIFYCIMVYKRGTPKTANNHSSFDSSSVGMEGDSFVLLFLVLFFVIFALSSLSIPKGTGILARSSNPFQLPLISFFWIVPIVIGLLFAVYSSSDASSTRKNYSTDFTLSLVMISVGLFAMYSLFTPKETPERKTSMFAFSSILFSPFFWSVVFVLLLLIAVYCTFNGSSSKMEYGTVVTLTLLMVFFAIFALNSLFASKDTPEPSKSSGFGFLSTMFFCSLIMVVIFLVMVYARSSGPSAIKMEGDNSLLLYLALFFVAFVLHYLFTPGKANTPEPKSTGFGFLGPFFWCVLIVIVLLIMAYCSSDARSMKTEDGTAIMVSLLMVFVAVFVLYSMFTSKAAPAPPPKSTGFLASIVFSPGFWVVGIVIFLVISNS